MSPLEIIATLLGLANILLLVRRSIWNYPAGIAMVSLYGFIFLEAKLYSDALLQMLFLALNIYGWVNWSRQQQDEVVPVRWLSGRGFAMTVAVAVVASLGWGWLMHAHTDAALPYWDAAVAMPSVLAQYLLARRWVDNWVWWIIVDLIAVPLYWTKDLHLTAGLYVLFGIVSATGLRAWSKAAVAR